MSESRSYRQILKSTSIIGGASVLNIGIGLVRTKIAAVLLGPAGVGLIGLFNNLIGTASTLAGLGFSTVGTRQIAEASGRGDHVAMGAARRALLWGTLILALIGGAAVFGFRRSLATYVLDDSRLFARVGWLGIGVALTVVAGSQGALLNGMRRIGDIARVRVYSAVLSTVVGCAAIVLWGEAAIITFVLAAPTGSFLFGRLFVARLPAIQAPPSELKALCSQWRVLSRLGAAFMLAGLVANAGQLVVRSLVQRELGAAQLGHFQAAWAISMTYLGLILSAMGTDYYPRLTEAIHEPREANRMVNEQTEVALLLAAPILLAMLGLAPWVIELLYSSRFSEAASILRWHVLGDLLKIASWPLGFVILAAGDGRTYLLSELTAMVAFVALVKLGLPLFGIVVTGAAFVCMYFLYLPLVYVLARRRTGFRWTSTVARQLAALAASNLALFGLAGWSRAAGGVAGIVLAGAFGFYGARRMARLSDMGSSPRVRALLARVSFGSKKPRPGAES